MCVLTKKIENILCRIFILLPESCPGVGLVGAGGGGESKTLAWGFAMARSSFSLYILMTFDLKVMAEIHKFCLSCDNFTI